MARYSSSWLAGLDQTRTSVESTWDGCICLDLEVADDPEPRICPSGQLSRRPLCTDYSPVQHGGWNAGKGLMTPHALPRSLLQASPGQMQGRWAPQRSIPSQAQQFATTSYYWPLRGGGGCPCGERPELSRLFSSWHDPNSPALSKSIHSCSLRCHEGRPQQYGPPRMRHDGRIC